MGIDTLTVDERKLLLLSVGTHREVRPLTPVEVGALFGRIMDSGGTLQQCATASGVEGTTIVTRFLRLRQLPQSIAHLIDWGSGAGSIGFSAAAEIARLEELADQEILADALLSNKLSGSEVRQIVQLRKRSTRSVEDCTREVLAMRSSVERRYVYVGAITDDRVRAKLAAMTQHQRDEAFARIISSVLEGKTPSLARLGVDRFTLAGASDLSDLFTVNRDLLERRTNCNLASELL